MNRSLLYHASMGIVGLSFLTRSVPDLVAGDPSIAVWLSTIAGVGLVLASVYEISTDDSENFEPSRRFTLFVVAGAVLTALFTGLSLLG